jgi:hypothetical protein
MPLSANLFDQIEPPSLWITVPAPECHEAETRPITIRLQEAGRRSISATVTVSRYAPEDSILLALSKMLTHLATAQVALDRDLLHEVLQQSVSAWVEPF